MKFSLGDAVRINGYSGRVYRIDVTPGGMMEVRLQSGIVCVDPDDVEPLTPRTGVSHGDDGR